MLLNNLSNKQIKELSAKIAPNLISHPAFMFYCKIEKNRQKFIEDYFNYFLNKWNNKEIILADEDNEILITLIDLKGYHDKDRGARAAKLKRHKNAYANVTYHQGNIAYLTNIVAPANIDAKIMTIYSTLKNRSKVEALIDEVKAIAKEQNFMIVYETFSKKGVDILNKKGFETAYEKLFSGTQFYETVMTYYYRDWSQPAKLIDEFKPIVIHDDSKNYEENEEELTSENQ